MTQTISLLPPRAPVKKGRLVADGSGVHATPMQFQDLRTFALSLPHTKPSEQWGGTAFKVEGKVFLFVVPDAEVIEAVVFKCTPDEFDDLTQIDGIAQAPYFAKRLWVRVADLSALRAAELQRRIRRSYDLVVGKLPKKVQAALAAAASRAPRR